MTNPSLAYVEALLRTKKKGEIAKGFDEKSAAVILAGIAQGLFVMLRWLRAHLHQPGEGR